MEGFFSALPPSPFKAVESLQQNSCLETSSCKYGERGVSVLEVGGSATVFAYFGSLILCQIILRGLYTPTRSHLSTVQKPVGKSQNPWNRVGEKTKSGC